MNAVVSKRKILIWEIICVLGIVMPGGPLHEVFAQSGGWRPLALIAPVNESVWEHLKMFFWPWLLMACIQYLIMRPRIPHYWYGKLVALVLTPVVSSILYYIYMAVEHATGDFSPSDVVNILLSTVSVCIGQAACYFVLIRPAVSADFTRFTKAGYAVLVFAFSTFTYFAPPIFLFEQNHHYQPIGEYGIDAAPQVGPHPWDIED